MSQSPTKALRVQRYEDGWEVINRMIREDLSWGGNERNCFLMASGDGSFANVSAASGIDYRDDGRALGVLDVDRDGRPDLVLRNRTAPLVRILHNTWPHPGHALWLRLEGRDGNRDAIGARIHLRTPRGLRVKEVQAGNLFLSQSSRWIPFGLDRAREAQVTIRWPGGNRQSLGSLEAGRRYAVAEGEPPRPVPFEPSVDYEGASRSEPQRPLRERGETPLSGDDASSVATGLLDPEPAPTFALAPLGAARKRDASARLGPQSLRGKPLFLHFLSITCSVCLAEAPAIRRAERAVKKTGAAFLHVIVNLASARKELEEFVGRVGFGAPVVQADERTLRAYNVIHRQFWNLREDLAVPTTFLLDAAGAVIKVYRGHTRPEVLARDATLMPRTAEERLRLALRYPGTLHNKTYRRDLVALGNAFLEAGLDDLARKTFQRSMSRNVGDPDSLFNFAVASAGAGHLEEAKEAYRKVVAMAPSSDDARNNLAVLLARSGDERAAQRMFRSIVERNPAHGEAPLNLGNLLLERKEYGAALEVLRKAAASDPESALFHRHLGYALYRAGALDKAIESHRTSLRLDPFDSETHLGLAILFYANGDPEKAKKVALDGSRLSPRHAGLHNTLGMAQLRLGEIDAGIASLEKAIEIDPLFDRPYLNLARFYEEGGQPEAARAILGRLIEKIPEHPVGQR